VKFPGRFISMIAVFATLFMLFPKSAFAYVDPGTGSYIFQILVGAIFGAAFAIKLYWKRIKSYFSNRSSKNQEDGQGKT